MARLSHAVYRTTSKLNQKPHERAILADLQSEDPEFVSVQGFNKDSTQAMVVEHNDYIAVVFRGSNQMANWMENMNLFFTEAFFGEFHTGFYQAAASLWRVLEEAVDQLRLHKRRPVFLTGHSLGGALATVLAAKWLHEGRPFVNVYTFGQPRVVSQATARVFCVECKERFFRFHNNNDAVTRIPLRLMGYRHVGTYLYISEEGTIHRDVGFWFRFMDRLDGAWEAIKALEFADSVRDHAMGDYLEHVGRWRVGD